MPLRIDSHQHFWTLERDDYGWLTPESPALYRDFLPAHLKPLLTLAGIRRTILVQAAPTVDETRYLLELAERHDFIAGVVGWVDMEGGKASLDDLATLRKNPLFLGVRPMIQDIADPAWMLRSSLLATLRAVVELDLCFDALVKPVHLPYLRELLRRHPDLRVVVDHGAKPDIAGGGWQPWADGLMRIGKDTSAYCKLSGLITQARNTHPFTELIPYMDHILASFGAERVMWGSDWPVLNLASTFLDWHRLVGDWLRSKGTDAERAIGTDTAIRFYGLDVKYDDFEAPEG